MAKNTAYSGSNKQHSFSLVPKAEIPRSTFNRSSTHKTTFDSGKLIPIYLDQDILPGDTVNLSASVFARMATPIYPLLDQLFIDTFWFFVPNRLVWDKWAFFMGEEEAAGDAQIAPKYTTPQVTFSNVTVGSLQDYMGLPLTASPITVSALPFRALALIWNEWFRDENLQVRTFFTKAGGVVSPPSTPDTGSNYVLMPRGKRKDYFTSCLPWPQKGPTVLLPLGTSAPVTISPNGTNPPTFQRPSTPGGFPSSITSQASGTGIQFTNAGGTSALPVHWDNPQLTGLANLAGATSATINELRQSFQIQRLLERDARGGTRLTELLRSHFGVVSPDARLQRPEYLAGATVNVQMNLVPQTSETTGTGVQGGLAAYATASGHGGSFQHSFTEHGILICLASIRAPLSYQQGLHKSWTRKTRFDHYWPALQAIGEQAVKNSEIFYLGTPVVDDMAFGYQERWGEYRYKSNTITGQFRSDAPTPLDAWHLAQDFASLPTLNTTFVADTPPVSRVVAVPSEPEFLLEAFFECKQTRVMPVYSVPGMMDHF